MMPTVKATKTSRTQSVLQDFFQEFMKRANYIAICAAVRFHAPH